MNKEYALKLFKDTNFKGSEAKSLVISLRLLVLSFIVKTDFLKAVPDFISFVSVCSQ